MGVIDDDGELGGLHHLDKPIVASSSGARGESEDTVMSGVVDVEVEDVIVLCVNEEDDEEVEGVMAVDVVVVVVVVVPVVVVGGACIRIEGVLADVAVDGCSNAGGCNVVVCVVGFMRMVRARRSWYAGDDGVGDVGVGDVVV
jgi:hypothetical protein